jgi:hypothetical protein
MAHRAPLPLLGRLILMRKLAKLRLLIPFPKHILRLEERVKRRPHQHPTADWNANCMETHTHALEELNDIGLAE